MFAELYRKLKQYTTFLILYYRLWYIFDPDTYKQTEQIRRINRLFAQDSLFLRQHLMIPVDKESPYYTLELDAAVTNLRRPEMLVIADDTTVAANSASVSAETVTTAVLLSPEEESRKDIDAFLGKIDSTLAQTRKYVAKSQNSIEWVILFTK